ncbi:MAG: hypothetical protein V4657_03850 [Pseudomonadota bacterium]
MATFTDNGIIYEDLGDGQVKIVGYAQPGQPSGYVPPNSMRVAKEREEQERRDKQDARAAQAAALAQEKFDREIAEGNKPKLPAGYMMAPDGKSAMLIPGVAAPGSTAGGKTSKEGAYKSVIQQIDRLYQLYNDGIGSTEGVAGLMDYLPTESNAMFDTAGAALGDQGNAAFKVPGMGAQSDADAARFVAANQPQASDRDGAALEKLRALRQRLENNMDSAGLPAPQWNYGLDGQPVNERRDDPAAAGNQGVDRSNRDDVLFNGVPGDGGKAGFVPYGQEFRNENNPEWKGVNEAVKGMIIAGQTPEQIKAYMNSKGIAGDATTGIDEAIGYYRKTGKRNFGVDVDDIRIPLTGQEQFENNAPQTRLGTFAATAANAGAFGVPQMLAGDEGLDYLREQNPGSAFAGDVAGVIGATSAVGKLGSSAARRFAPGIMGGGKWAQRGRNLAPDATYGAIYGATTEGDPLTGAATATLGSLGGQGIGKGIQKGFEGGGDLAAAALRERGIPLTFGQAMGGTMKRIEDGATSIPFIGDMVSKRRMEGLEAFNRAAFEDAGAPIGATIDGIGEAGIDALRPQISNAYDRATDGVNVPLDGQFASDIAPLLQQGSALSGDYGAGFARLINNRVRPALDAGELTGANYQNMTRAMRDSRGSVKGQPFAEDYIEPVRGMEDATRALMQRQGGESVIGGLGRADEAYRNSKVLGTAIEAGKNTDGVFMPSQLNNASVANARKFGGNGATESRPFRDLAMQGQSVLPSKLADSGTALRVGVGGGLLGTITGGASYLSSGDPMTTVGAPVAATSLLALLGTKKGQQLLVKSLMDRPASVRKAGGIFGGRKARRAIGGAITAPLLIGN